MMFTLSSSAHLTSRHQTFTTTSSSSLKKKNKVNDGRKCTVTIDASSARDSNPTRRDAVLLVSSSILYALPALAFGGSKEAKPDLTTSRDAKKAAILAAARAKAEGQAAKITEEEPRKELQSAEFFDASNSGAGVRGGGPNAGNTYEVAKEEEAPAAPEPAAPEPAAPAAPEPAAPAPEPAAPADEGGFSLPSVSLPSVSLPSVSLPSLPKLPF
jgi:hypothetical protein